MPSEFRNREPPLPFGNPKSRPWYRYGYFLESPNFSCKWEREFVFLGGWDARLAREPERDMGFQFQCDFIPAQKPQAGGNEPFVRIAVSGFKYWIATALYPVRSCQMYPLSLTLSLVSDRKRSLSPTVIFCLWHKWHLSISDICVCILDLSVLSPDLF